MASSDVTRAWVTARADLPGVLEAHGLRSTLTATHQHLFAPVVLHLPPAALAQMHAVIAAVQAVAGRPEEQAPQGVFYGYDFHVNAEGVHLIELNTNAGGAFVNALLLQGGEGEARMQEFLAMFRAEWRRARGEVPLTSVAIVDEQPDTQYLYPEFLLAQHLFERAGLAVWIADPAQLEARAEGIFIGTQRVDMIYNRLTDFDLAHHPALRAAWQGGQVVLTPNPHHHARYADKSLLIRLSDAALLRSEGVAAQHVEALQRSVPETRRLDGGAAERWWGERRQWFFKPVAGYGSKGAYRGDKLTRRVFEQIMAADDYLAQRLTPPGEVEYEVAGTRQVFKFDVRCYVYDGEIQLIAARLYQGQTTNFRTPGGGFAAVSFA
ncbi:MAG: hypothetical protein Fur0040_02180 [Sideroxydans sp.]